jgi:hypothetical protein
MSPGSLLSVHLPERVMQQNVGAARGVGACVISNDGIEAEPGLQQFAFEPAVEIVASRFREQIEQGTQIFRGQPTKPVAEPPGFE